MRFPLFNVTRNLKIMLNKGVCNVFKKSLKICTLREQISADHLILLKSIPLRKIYKQVKRSHHMEKNKFFT